MVVPLLLYAYSLPTVTLATTLSRKVSRTPVLPSGNRPSAVTLRMVQLRNWSVTLVAPLMAPVDSIVTRPMTLSATTMLTFAQPEQKR